MKRLHDAGLAGQTHLAILWTRLATNGPGLCSTAKLVRDYLEHLDSDATQGKHFMLSAPEDWSRGLTPLAMAIRARRVKCTEQWIALGADPQLALDFFKADCIAEAFMASKFHYEQAHD